MINKLCNVAVMPYSQSRKLSFEWLHIYILNRVVQQQRLWTILNAISQQKNKLDDLKLHKVTLSIINHHKNWKTLATKWRHLLEVARKQFSINKNFRCWLATVKLRALQLIGLVVQWKWANMILECRENTWDFKENCLSKIASPKIVRRFCRPILI